MMFLDTSLVRLELGVVDFELGQILAFHEHAEEGIGKQVDLLHQRIQAAGLRDGRQSDRADELYVDLFDLQRLNAYSGVVLAYAVLESFLLHLIRAAKLEIYEDPEIDEEHYTLKRYKVAMSKLGIDIAQEPFEIDELITFNRFRNHIVHSYGWIAPTKQQLSDTEIIPQATQLALSDDYVQKCVRLVGKTCHLIAEKYASTFAQVGSGSQSTQ